MKNIAIFASGSGSNAQKIVEHFSNKAIADVKMIFSNKSDAFIVDRARNLNIPCRIFNRDEFYNSENILKELLEHKIDLIVLAGFLWLVPQNLLHSFPKKIVNIHPALLPKYGGKGMFGSRVHEAVIANGEQFSGITIHYINEKYDEGDIIFQAQCVVLPTDSADDVASKVHELEYKYFATTIENLIEKM